MSLTWQKFQLLVDNDNYLETHQRENTLKSHTHTHTHTHTLNHSQKDSNSFISSLYLLISINEKLVSGSSV
jgi:hypothetical protein